MKKLFLFLSILTASHVSAEIPLFYGYTECAKDEGVAPYICPMCKNQLNFVSMRPWATFEFIAIFPIGRKTYHFFCTSCGSKYVVPANIDVEAILKEAAAKIPLTKFQKVWKVLKHPLVWGTPLAAFVLKIAFDESYYRYLKKPWGYDTWSREEKIAHTKKVLMYYRPKYDYSADLANSMINSYSKHWDGEASPLTMAQRAHDAYFADMCALADQLGMKNHSYRL